MYSLTLYPPVSTLPRLAVRTITEFERDALSWSTGPGGFVNLQCTVADAGLTQVAYLTEPDGIRAFYHARLRYGSFVVWEGRIMHRNRQGGGAITFNGAGYGTKLGGMEDHAFYSTNTTALTSGQCLQAIIEACAPVSVQNTGLWEDPGTAHTLNDFGTTGMTPQQVIDQLAQESNGSIPFDFAVWENGSATYRQRLTPPWPHYVVPIDEDLDIDEDFSTIWSAVTINYQIPPVAPSTTPTPATYTAGPNALVAQTYIPRDTNLQAPTQATVPVQAVANLALAGGAAPKTSYTIHVHGDKPLRNRFGGEVSHEQIRFGQWVQIGADGPMAMIVATEHNGITDECTVTAGALPTDSFFTDLDSRGMVLRFRAGLNPVTGAPGL